MVKFNAMLQMPGCIGYAELFGCLAINSMEEVVACTFDFAVIRSEQHAYTIQNLAYVCRKPAVRVIEFSVCMSGVGVRMSVCRRRKATSAFCVGCVCVIAPLEARADVEVLPAFPSFTAWP